MSKATPLQFIIVGFIIKVDGDYHTDEKGGFHVSPENKNVKVFPSKDEADKKVKRQEEVYPNMFKYQVVPVGYLATT